MWDRMPYLCADEYSRLLRFGLESPGRVYGAIKVWKFTGNSNFQKARPIRREVKLRKARIMAPSKATAELAGKELLAYYKARVGK